jgi:hypothetical protein
MGVNRSGRLRRKHRRVEHAAQQRAGVLGVDHRGFDFGVRATSRLIALTPKSLLC